MRAVILSVVAAIAATACVACSGGLQQTPLPGVESQPGAQAPASSGAPDTSDSSSESSDDQPDQPPVTSSRPAEASPSAHSPAHSPAPHSAARPAAHSGAQSTFHNVCPSAAPGRRECALVVRGQAHHGCSKTAPYCASDLQAAYGVAQVARARNRGVLVAVVDAYGYPGAASDLAVYRKSMGLPACAPSGCLRVVNQSGRTSPLPKPNADPGDDWRAEEAVDVQMVSALCPNCKVLLVQANSNKDADLAAGVNAAVALGAAAISNSYGGDESDAVDAAYAHAGRAITASAGDDAVNQPCTYSGVVCVGGTTLTASGRGWSERPWRGGGSACSAYVAKPSWQRMHGCAMRGVADVSAVADPKTGVAFYEAAGGGWQQAGGTGVAAPIVAALFALEPSTVRANAPAWLWRHGRKAPKIGGV